MSTPLSSEPLSTWRALPRSAVGAKRRCGRFFFKGEKCGNGHLAPSMVGRGCIMCIALGHARYKLRIAEKSVKAEIRRLGRAYRPRKMDPNTAVSRVLLAVAAADGLLTRAELVDPTVRGMSEGNVHAAFAKLIKRDLITARAPYIVTGHGYRAASMLGVQPTTMAHPQRS